jgi:TRAP-type transport system small permease protein
MAASDIEVAIGAGGTGRRLIPPGPWVPAPLRVLGSIVDWAAIFAGATIILIVFANVIVHQFNVDIAWTTEFSELLMVWVTFLGGAAAGRRGEHVALLEIINLLPAGLRHAIDAAVQVVSAAVLCLLVWYGMGIVEAARTSQMSVLGWPMSVEYLALPVSSAICLIYVLLDLVRIARGVSREDRYKATPC